MDIKKLLILSVIFIAIFCLGRYLVYRPLVQTKIINFNQQVTNLQSTIALKPTTITPQGLPDFHIIETAFIPQAPEKNWDQPWQDSCEEAALLTIDYYHRRIEPTTDQIKNAILDMVEYETSQGWSDDINIAQMASLSAKYLNYTPSTIDHPDLATIKTLISQDTPVLIPASGKILYTENKNFRNGGPYYHNLVILGYDDARQQFIVHDVGTRYGRYFRYSYNLLLAAIHDFPATGQKEDINQGEKRVLILLQ